MGNIRDKQLELLQNTGEELILFKKYDKDGGYVDQYEVNVLIQSPRELRPFEDSLVVEYQRPIKKVEMSIPLRKKTFPTGFGGFASDPTLKYGGYKYTIDSSASVIKNSDLESNTITQLNNIRAVSGERCIIDSTNSYTLATPTLSDITSNLVEIVKLNPDNHFLIQSKGSEYGFSYNVVNTSSEAEFYFAVLIRVHNSTTSSLFFNHDENKWDDVSGDPTSTAVPDLKYLEIIDGSDCNKWENYSKSLPNYPNVGAFSNGVELVIYSVAYTAAAKTATHKAVLLDNVYVKHEVDEDNIDVLVQRKQTSSNTYTGVYKVDDLVLTGSKANTDKSFSALFYSRHNGKNNHQLYRGLFEFCISQEYLNDYRNFLITYEGTFYNNNPTPIPVGMHNKIWINFVDGVEETHIDPVSCYINSITYSVKANTFDLTLHLPNQDDDVPSEYLVTFE